VARPLGGGWFWQVLLGTLALTVLGRLATLPLSARSELVLRRYGLSTQTWASWLVDALKGVLVGAGLTALAMLALVAVARRTRHWWAWGALATAGLVVAGSFAYPLVVEPVFNRFTPLPAGELRSDLLALAEEDGVAVEEVLVADASRRTTAVNAYVSGFGSSRRIVVYDTLLDQAEPAEVRLVVAHELGHAAERDVLVGTLLGALASGAAVCALAPGPVVGRRCCGGPGRTGMADPRGRAAGARADRGVHAGRGPGRQPGLAAGRGAGGTCTRSTSPATRRRSSRPSSAGGSRTCPTSSRTRWPTRSSPPTRGRSSGLSLARGVGAGYGSARGEGRSS
jgi:hypothetical protein